MLCSWSIHSIAKLNISRLSVCLHTNSMVYVSDLQSYLGLDTDAPLLNKSYVNCLMYADDLVLISRWEVGLQGLIVNDREWK